MATSVIILPSPLLPGSVHDGLRDSLGERGFTTSVASPLLGPGEGAVDLVRRWSAQLHPGTVLVAHSNAGYVAPLVRAAVSAPCPIVFMDAALLPAAGPCALAPADFRQLLEGLADATGLLPPWTRWWPRSDLVDVIPPDLFDVIDQTCPRLPLHYFDEEVTAPAGWVGGSNAYLAFDDTYHDERAFAQRCGWPVADLAGSHVAFLSRPDDVADAITLLLEQLRW